MCVDGWEVAPGLETGADPAMLCLTLSLWHTSPLPRPHTRHWPIFSGFTPRLSGPGCRDQQMKFKHRGHHRKLVQSIAIKSPDLYVFYPSNLDIRLAILPLDLGEEDKDPTCQTVTHCIKEWRRVGLFKTGKMCFVYQYHTT